MYEGELIEALRRRDKDAHEEAYVLYKDVLTAVVKKYVDLEEDVEELVQDVFVKAFRKIDQFNGASKLSTWVIKIAINTAENFLESIKKRKEVINKTVDINDGYDWASGYSDPEELLINQEGRNALLKAMGLLTEKQKTVFLLYYIEGLSQLEISDIMGVSVDAVESLVQRAKMKIRTLFEKNSIT